MPTGTDEPCEACRAGFQNECHFAWIREDHDSCGEVKFDAAGNVRTDEAPISEDGEGVDGGYLGELHEGSKSLSSYADPISTGRKMAAEKAPINVGMICEWAGLAKAGGGVVPIVGCVGRPASDRHHGPDKNTMNNVVGVNLHRICDHCHNTWHAKNDPAYGPRPTHTQPFIPEGVKGIDWFEHDAVTRATPEQIMEAETKRLAEI